MRRPVIESGTMRTQCHSLKVLLEAEQGCPRDRHDAHVVDSDVLSLRSSRRRSPARVVSAEAVPGDSPGNDA